jgi:hypothetical protein
MIIINRVIRHLPLQQGAGKDILCRVEIIDGKTFLSCDVFSFFKNVKGIDTEFKVIDDTKAVVAAFRDSLVEKANLFKSVDPRASERYREQLAIFDKLIKKYKGKKVWYKEIQENWVVDRDNVFGDNREKL